MNSTHTLHAQRIRSCRTAADVARPPTRSRPERQRGWCALLLAGGLCALPLAGLSRAAADPAQDGAPESLRLYVLDCGVMDSLAAERFLPEQGVEGEELSLVNRCYLIRHPKGTLLWDTGLPDAAASWFQRNLYWLLSLGEINVRLDRTLGEQLEEIGVAPGDIDFLALSHLHTDHVGTANNYAASTWLVQRPEFEVAFDESFEVFDASYYSELENSSRKILDGDFDVFGDGKVVILSAPGHTPGHQCLFLDLAKRGPVVLSGDLYHTQRNRELRVAPSFNTDREQSVRSMEKIEAFILERGAELWIQHDRSSNEGIPLSPEVID